MDSDLIEFGGLAGEISEDEFAAGVTNELMKNLFEEWKAAGSPKPPEQWIRGKLGHLFVCAGDRPRWPRDVQDWPEYEGRPMVFLGQFEVPEFSLSTGHKSPTSLLFLFGAPDGPPGGWQMVTKAMHLHASFKRAKLKAIKGVDNL